MDRLPRNVISRPRVATLPASPRGGTYARNADDVNGHLVSDTGLAAGALSMCSQRLATAAIGGAFLESFVLAELKRQATSIDEVLTFAHFRDRSGVEVDVIIERPDGSVIAIEVKSSRSVSQRDARGLVFLRDRLDDRFQCGILLHTGPITARLGERVWAVPVAALWDGD